MPLPDYLDKTLPFASASLKPAPSDYSTEFTAWKAKPDKTTMQTLLSAVGPVISGAVKGYGDSPTLRGQAKLLAVKSFDTYDPERGPLKNHLISHLSGLQRLSAKNDQIISIPERIAIDQSHLRSAEKDLENSLGRSANDRELAERTGISLKRIGYIRGARGGISTSKMVDADGAAFSPASTRPGDDAMGDMWHEMVYHDLSDIDKVIMEHSLGLRDKPVLENRQLAVKLGISPGAVSQRKAKIQASLDERYTHSIFSE